MSETKNSRFEQAASLVKIHGIISIVFGAIGVFFGLLFLTLFGIALGSAYSDSDAIGYLLLFVGTALFWVVPHVYLIIAGATLIRIPDPKLTKTLTIINLIFGVFWNYILLVFAIISLTQSRDYEEGYEHRKK